VTDDKHSSRLFSNTPKHRLCLSLTTDMHKMATLISDTTPWKDLKSHVGEIEKTHLCDLMNDADRC
ncbi:hypothetical protein Tco_1233752, partial [Tanacetum coccineum]